MLGHHPFCCKKLEFPYFILYTGVNTVPLDFQTFAIDRIVTVPSSTCDMPAFILLFTGRHHSAVINIDTHF